MDASMDIVFMHSCSVEKIIDILSQHGWGVIRDGEMCFLAPEDTDYNWIFTPFDPGKLSQALSGKRGGIHIYHQEDNSGGQLLFDENTLTFIPSVDAHYLPDTTPGILDSSWYITHLVKPLSTSDIASYTIQQSFW